MANTKSGIFQIGLVGGDTLLGHELTEVLEAQLSGALVTRYSAHGEATFGQSEGEAIYVQPLDAQAIETIDVILTAGAAEGSLKAYSLAKACKGGLPVIDCAGHLEREPEARVLAPVPGEANPSGVWLYITAQPAAAAIAEALLRLSRWRPLVRSVANIFEPASERGKPGAAELHQQTSSLLAFRGLDKDVFDAQLGFNMLPRYGPAAPFKLAAAERRIEQHIALLLGRRQGGPGAPSVRLIQVPVFHAYSISLWIEFGADIAVSDLGHALASAQIEVREANQEAPTGIGATGHSGLIAGDIRIDRGNPRAAWLWLAFDNLRMTADFAVSILRSLEAQKP